MVKYLEKNSPFYILLKSHKDIFNAPEDKVIIAYNYEGEEGYQIALERSRMPQNKSK